MDLPTGVPVEARRANHSLATLTLTADILQHRTRRAGALGSALTSLDIDAFDLTVDPTRERVVIHLKDDDHRRMQAHSPGLMRTTVADGLPAPVHVEPGMAKPECTRGNCRPEMMGGLIFQRVLGTNMCTSGFVMFDSSGRRFSTSAAHCPSTERYHGGIRFGSVTDQIQSGPSDFERIDRTSGTWSYQPGRMWITSSEIRRLQYYITHPNIVIGTQVGKSGYQTGTTRGYIGSKYFRPSYVSNSFNFVTVPGMCSAGGDSGGPVFRNTTAYGLHSGRVGGCNDANQYAIFGAAGYMMGAFDAQFQG